jgi:hypothetical protein
MKSIKGMSLIELMIATGIGAVVVLGVMAAVEVMFKSQKTSESGQEVTALMYEVNGILNNPPLCTAALKGVAGTDAVATPVQLSPAVKSATKYGGINLSNVLLQNKTHLTGLNYSAEVQVDGDRSGNVYGSKNFVQKSIVYYSVDAANKIEQCLGADKSPAADCGSIGGIWVGTKCDFCSGLGGTTQADGSCLLPSTAKYVWLPDSWGTCTNNTQTRTVACVDADTGVAGAEANCTLTKPATTQACTDAGSNKYCSVLSTTSVAGINSPDVTAADKAAAQAALDAYNTACRGKQPPVYHDESSSCETTLRCNASGQSGVLKWNFSWFYHKLCPADCWGGNCAKQNSATQFKYLSCSSTPPNY